MSKIKIGDKVKLAAGSRSCSSFRGTKAGKGWGEVTDTEAYYGSERWVDVQWKDQAIPSTYEVEQVVKHRPQVDVSEIQVGDKVKIRKGAGSTIFGRPPGRGWGVVRKTLPDYINVEWENESNYNGFFLKDVKAHKPKKDKTPLPTFQKGDKVRIIGNWKKDPHYCAIGTEVTIEANVPHGVAGDQYKGKNRGYRVGEEGVVSWLVRARDLELVQAKSKFDIRDGDEVKLDTSKRSLYDSKLPSGWVTVDEANYDSFALGKVLLVGELLVAPEHVTDHRKRKLEPEDFKPGMRCRFTQKKTLFTHVLTGDTVEILGNSPDSLGRVRVLHDVGHLDCARQRIQFVAPEDLEILDD